jgi:hypothetical protein
VLWLVLESDISVLLDVANAEVDVEVVLYSADELVEIASANRLVEEM